MWLPVGNYVSPDSHVLSMQADCQNYYQTIIIRMLVYEISGCLDYVGRMNAISKGFFCKNVLF